MATAPAPVETIAPLPPPRPAPDAVQPKIETVARPATAPQMPVTDAQRFERALAGAGSAAHGASDPAPATKPAATARPVATPPPAPAAEPAKMDRGAMAAAAAAAAALGSLPSAPKPSVVSPPTVLEPPPRPAMPVALDTSGPAPVVADAGAVTDDLTRIRAINSDLQERLYNLGVSKYGDIAHWTSADVKRIGAALGIAQRISTENWIEQAQILSKGGTTDFASRLAGVAVPLGTPSADQGTAAPVTQAAAPAAAPAPIEAPPAAPSTQGFELPRTGAQAAAAAAAAIAAAAAASRRSSTPSETDVAAIQDNLQRINGIDSNVEKLLSAEGVTRYAQIAAWTEADVSRFTPLLGSPGRIARENWIEQAAILAGGAATYARRSETAPRVEPEATRPARLMDAIKERESTPPQPAAEATSSAPASAPAARPDLSHLRSIRSEALRKDAGTGAVDDLKRIRGIGVLIEKKLNSLGVASYEQIANWTSGDVDRISQLLDFKGRIERESWVEQARILSSGGHTEFSIRVDRNDS
jgi:predicted flap endonuclease-1-like 5' DNA nuclease